jgi:hypothetical protein
MSIFQRRHIIRENYRNATGDISVLQVLGPYPDGTIAIWVFNRNLTPGFVIGSNITYTYGSLVISGNIVKIGKDNGEDPLAMIYIQDYSHQVTKAIMGGTVSLTSASASSYVVSPSPVITAFTDLNTSASPVVSQLSSFNLQPLSAPVEVAGGVAATKIDAYSTQFDPSTGITKTVYNPVVAASVIDSAGNVSFPLLTPDPVAPTLVTSHVDTITGAQSDVPISSDTEMSAGMIVPSTQPAPVNVPKTINSSSIILFLVLGGVALWGINKV